MIDLVGMLLQIGDDSEAKNDAKRQVAAAAAFSTLRDRLAWLQSPGGEFAAKVGTYCICASNRNTASDHSCTRRDLAWAQQRSRWAWAARVVGLRVAASTCNTVNLYDVPDVHLRAFSTIRTCDLLQ